MNSQFLKKGTLKQSHASSNSCVSSPCELPHDSAQNQARSKLKGPCAVTDKARRQLVRAFGNTTNDMTKNLCIANPSRTAQLAKLLWWGQAGFALSPNLEPSQD